MTNILPESRRAEGHRLLGPLDHRGDRRRAVDRLLDVPLRLARALPGGGGAQHHGDHRVVPAAAARRRRGERPGRLIEWRVLPLVHAVSLLVRLRRDHQLHRAVRRRQRRHAEGDLPDDAGGGDSGDAAAGRTAGRSVRLYRRVFLPCLVLIAVGLSCLVFGGSTFLAGHVRRSSSAPGFGTAYPVFAGYVMRHVGPERRGAAFGAILACFDTGIGTGSTSMGWIIEPTTASRRLRRPRRFCPRSRCRIFSSR